MLKPVFSAGETYAVDRDLDDDAIRTFWMMDAHEVFVAERDGQVLGTYYLMPNRHGGGAHVANCGYVTAAAAQGQGIASAMCRHSLDRARQRGFRAMQFNHVVSTNRGAVALWQKLGFDIVGILPGAFHHPVHGYVDAFVMFQTL
nr:GNAT family N-acetyltransferase [Devosia chinhatensis]